MQQVKVFQRPLHVLRRAALSRKSRTDMTDTHSKSRQRAEIAFGNVQSQFLARSRAVEEIDQTVRAREEKTLRLREAREAKELQDRLMAAAGPAKQKKKK